jgi:hypothetical protein
MRIGYREYKSKVKSQQIPVPVIPDGYRECSDCKEVKELNEINFRKNCGERRYYCNRCDECQKIIDKEYAQVKRWEEKQKKQIEYSTNPEYKQCSDCMEYQPLDNYYLNKNGHHIKRCKECHGKMYKEYKNQKLIDTGGADSYYKEPNRYWDEEQKKNVFMVMEALGWIFDEPTGIWNKPGIKENGVFINMVLENKPKRKTSYPHGRKIKSGVWNNTDKIVKLIEEGYTYNDVADTFDCSHTTIRLVVTKYRNGEKP